MIDIKWQILKWQEFEKDMSYKSCATQTNGNSRITVFIFYSTPNVHLPWSIASPVAKLCLWLHTTLAMGHRMSLWVMIFDSKHKHKQRSGCQKVYFLIQCRLCHMELLKASVAFALSSFSVNFACCVVIIIRWGVIIFPLALNNISAC